jgi:hypothetical protein
MDVHNCLLLEKRITKIGKNVNTWIIRKEATTSNLPSPLKSSVWNPLCQAGNPEEPKDTKSIGTLQR